MREHLLITRPFQQQLRKAHVGLTVQPSTRGSHSWLTKERPTVPQPQVLFSFPVVIGPLLHILLLSGEGKQMLQ